MPRVIVKCKYIPAGSAHGGAGGLMRYVATREGVDTDIDSWKNRAATSSQEDLIRHITETLPTTMQTSEYTYYALSKTRGDASEFISSALESHPQLLQEDSYLRYMATRPRVEKSEGKHGLFSDSDKVLDLEEEVQKLHRFEGNVFTVIVSLKREDAARLGYDNAERWKSLLRSQIDLIAKQYRIPKSDLRWYAAFHNEAHHPHIHMLLYSTNKNAPGYISKGGIQHIRSLFGTEIFADDLHNVYDRQTEARNALTKEMRSEFAKLIGDMPRGIHVNDEVLNKIELLAHRLHSCTGKLQYGYLSKGIRLLVDDIVDTIARDDHIDRIYDLWYQAKCSVYQTYTDNPPERLPLSKEKAFIPIRNALIQEAAKLAGVLYDTGSNGYGNNSKRSGKGKNKLNSTNHRAYVLSAAISFLNSLSDVFREKCRKYIPEEDDIDRQYRREVQAIKNGENISM